MPYLLPPIVITLMRLASMSPLHADDAHPRLEMTGVGEAAREIAADVLTDADSLADLVLLDHGAVFAVNLAGERHELRLELDDSGRVVGAAVWWTHEEPGIGHYDLSLLAPALAESLTLDAVENVEGALVLTIGGERIPLGEDYTDDDLEDVWDDFEGC
jgi:hypothetical protein